MTVHVEPESVFTLGRNGCSRSPEYAEEDHAWYLNIYREATESDLMENHYLDAEGEDIWSTMLEIIHCPFCGEKLPCLDKIDKKSYSQFSHIDSSGWSSKMM